MNNHTDPLVHMSSGTVQARHDEQRRRLLATAPRLARLLLRVEEDAYCDARPCPFCHASTESDERLPHAADCELDIALVDAGLRLGPPL